MKKMKGVSSVGEDPKIKLKHQSLLQDFDDLHKETEAMKKKLQLVKHKKLTLLDEVRFLSRRCKCLKENHPSLNNGLKKQVLLRGKKFDTQTGYTKKAKNDGKKEMIYMEPRSLQNSAPTLHPNQVGKKAHVRKSTPSIDLNQILREEEELEADFGEGVRTEETAKKNFIRSENDELIFRNVVIGPSQVLKRKISWQDQVTLRA